MNNYLRLSSREVAIVAALAALSISAQFIFHLGYFNPVSFIWIDLVGVFWVMSFLLFGFRGGLMTSLVAGLVLILDPSGGLVGATMKFIATSITWLSLFIFIKLLGQTRESFKKPLPVIGGLVVALVLRCSLMVPLYFYYAWPLFTSTSPELGFATVPWLLVAGLNAVQAIVDVGLAWIAVYVFRLEKFSQTDARNSS